MKLNKTIISYKNIYLFQNTYSLTNNIGKIFKFQSCYFSRKVINKKLNLKDYIDTSSTNKENDSIEQNELTNTVIQLNETPIKKSQPKRLLADNLLNIRKQVSDEYNKTLAKISIDEKKEKFKQDYRAHKNKYDKLENLVNFQQNETIKENFNFNAINERNAKLNEPKIKGKNNIIMNIESIFDEETFLKLEQMYKNKPTTTTISKLDEELEIFDEESNSDIQKEVKKENIENSYDNVNDDNKVLVHRPHKNFKWGLGEQLQRKRGRQLLIIIVKFTKGEFPTIEQVVNFLELCNLKDIIVFPTKELGFLHLKEHSILCSGFTTKHIYKSAVDMLIELKNLLGQFFTLLRLDDQLIAALSFLSCFKTSRVFTSP